MRKIYAVKFIMCVISKFISGGDVVNIKKHLMCLSIAAVMAVCTGCNEAIEAWKPIESGSTIQIAVVGNDEFYTNGGTVEAIQLA